MKRVEDFLEEEESLGKRWGKTGKRGEIGKRSAGKRETNRKRG